MMHGGSLQHCTVESVLTQAADESATGGIDVHAGVRGTILLDAGKVSYAVLHGSHVRSDLGATAEPTPEALQASIRDVVGTLLDVASGAWEFTSPHPMSFRVPPRHRTHYEVRHLLDDLASHRDLGPLDAWSGVLVDVLPGDGQDEFVLDADMWRIISTLVDGRSIRAIAEATGLEPMRLALALARMQVRGMFGTRSEDQPTVDDQPTADDQPTETSPDAGHDVGPIEYTHFDPVAEHTHGDDDVFTDPEPLIVPAEWSTPAPETQVPDPPARPVSSIHEALARMTVTVEDEDVEEQRLRRIDLLPEALRPITIRDPEPLPPIPEPEPEPEPEPDVEAEVTGGTSTDRRGALSRLISSLRR